MPPIIMEESGGRSLFYFSSLSDFCFFSLFSLITTATMRHTNQTTTQMIIMMMRSLTEELIVCLFFIVVMYAFLSIVSTSEDFSGLSSMVLIPYPMREWTDHSLLW